jgi:hypothetical protein
VQGKAKNGLGNTTGSQKMSPHVTGHVNRHAVVRSLFLLTYIEMAATLGGFFVSVALLLYEVRSRLDDA